jgi:hypothetical protein
MAPVRHQATVCIVSLLLACARERTNETHPIRAEPVSPKPSSLPNSVPQDASQGERWTCGNDSECAMSCSQGAVNVDWYRTKFAGAECDDGCAGKGITSRCIELRCVAFNHKGFRLDSCTQKAP